MFRASLHLPERKSQTQWPLTGFAGKHNYCPALKYASRLAATLLYINIYELNKNKKCHTPCKNKIKYADTAVEELLFERTVAHWALPYFLLHHWRSCLLLMRQTWKHGLIVSYSSQQITLWNFFLHTKAKMTSCLCRPLLPTEISETASPVPVSSRNDIMVHHLKPKQVF